MSRYFKTRFIFVILTSSAMLVAGRRYLHPLKIGRTDAMYCGSTSFGQEHLENIVIHGATELAGTHIRQLTVNGSLQATHAKIHELHVNGAATMASSKVTSNTNVNGLLEASHCTFKKISIATTTGAGLRASKATEIVVKKDPLSRVQRLNLLNGTHITGSIKFESGKGEIWLSHDSHIDGTVKGAKIIRP